MSSPSTTSAHLLAHVSDVLRPTVRSTVQALNESALDKAACRKRPREGNDLIVIDVRPWPKSNQHKATDVSLVPFSTEKLLHALEDLASESDEAVICLATNECIVLMNRRSCMRVSGLPSVLGAILRRLEAA